MANGTGLIERFYKEIIEGGNLDLIDELAMDDLIDHEQALPGQPPGKDGVRFFVTAVREAFPDIKVKTIEPWLADGNLEACYVILTGTHRGEMAGVPASGNSVEFDNWISGLSVWGVFPGLGNCASVRSFCRGASRGQGVLPARSWAKWGFLPTT
ncbi:ester cyclase [Arthrobacter sp. MA-N2]|uniref:ester cyclase n=1 Tax=Arthrobacter sp. MA-N2 TaxID=1101188 RepID=UPI0005532E3C|nr:ester cyclase [Arthrobacter sp. MA-N2]